MSVNDRAGLWARLRHAWERARSRAADDLAVYHAVRGCLRPGDCLVDVGNTHDPARHLFDHKPPAFPSRHDSCAAKLVWEHLLTLGKPVQHLQDLVLAVFWWDSFKRRTEFAEVATASKSAGFHAALDAAKVRGLNNVALYRRLRRWLDRMAGTGKP